MPPQIYPVSEAPPCNSNGATQQQQQSRFSHITNRERLAALHQNTLKESPGAIEETPKQGETSTASETMSHEARSRSL